MVAVMLLMGKVKEGWHLIDGSALLRDINRALDWELPTDGPKTLNGLVLEHLETLPESNLGLQIDGYRFETMQIKDTLIKHIKVCRVEMAVEND